MWCTVCVALACLATLSHAPTAAAIPRGIVDHLVDHSICRSVVEYDHVEDRVPRVIKQVKCASHPDTMCPSRTDPTVESSCCAQNSHHNVNFSCKELIDTVLVSVANGTTTQKTVSVGCVCTTTQFTRATESSKR